MEPFTPPKQIFDSATSAPTFNSTNPTDIYINEYVEKPQMYYKQKILKPNLLGGAYHNRRRSSSTARGRRSSKRRTTSRKQQKRRRGSRRAH